VEEVLDALVDAEADRLFAELSAATHRMPERHTGRFLHTKVSQVQLRVPKLRSLPFEIAFIKRYKRRESSATTPLCVSVGAVCERENLRELRQIYIS
jgi:transposase-like protein